MRHVHGFALALAIAFCGRTAAAKPNAVVVYVEGAEAGAVRDELAGTLPEGTTLVDAADFAGALASQGQTGPFKKKLDGASHAAAVKRLRDAAAATGAEAVLIGRVTKETQKHRVRLLLVDTEGQENALADLVLDLKGGSNNGEQIKATVGAALAKYKVAPPAETATAPEGDHAAAAAPPPPPSERATEADTPDSVSQRPTGLVTRSLFEIELGGEAVGRDFAYTDGITANLRSYSVAPAAMFSANAELFPLAGARGVLRDIGFIGGFSRSLFLDSSTSGGAGFSSAETAYLAGLRVRIHPSGDNGPEIGISDAYASQSFDFSGAAGPLATQVPSVAYSANRTAVDARIPIGKFALLAQAGFRAVLNAGAVAQRFRSTSVEGIDAGIGAAFAVTPGWEVRGLADYERYFYSFSPIPGDAYVAGGALDQFFGARLAVAWIY